jgi:hypothetical protein
MEIPPRESSCRAPGETSAGAGADPVPDRPTGVLQRLESLPMGALFFQGSDRTFGHAVAFGAVRRDGLLSQALATNRGRDAAAGEHQAVVGSRQARCSSACSTSTCGAARAARAASGRSSRRSCSGRRSGRSSPTWGWIPGRRPGDGRARRGMATRSPPAEERSPSGVRAMGWRASAAAGVALRAVSAIRPEPGIEARITTRGRSQPGCVHARVRPACVERALSRRAAPCPWRLLPLPGLGRAF